MNSTPISSIFSIQVFVLVLSVIGILCDYWHLLLLRQSYITTISAFTVGTPPRPYSPQQSTKYIGIPCSSSIRRSTFANSEKSEEVASLKSSVAQPVSIARPPRPSPTGYSYVEEGVYTNIEEEIEAMGGDPSFLVDATSSAAASTNIDSNENTVTRASDTSSTLSWEWDGVEEEDVYFDE